MAREVKADDAPRRRSGGRMRQGKATRASGLERLASEEVDRIGLDALHTVADVVPGYGSLLNGENRADVINGHQRHARIYFESLASATRPGDEALIELEAHARRRFHQGLALDELLRAHRIGVRVLWQSITELVPHIDLGRSAVFTLDYIDCVSSRLERAFLEERELAAETPAHVSMLFLARVLTAEAGGLENLEAEAAALGSQLGKLHITAVVESRDVSQKSAAVDDKLHLTQIGTLFRERNPQSLMTLLRDQLVLCIPGSSAADVASAISLALATSGMQSRLTIGVGAPHPGAVGLCEGYREAQKALALGGMLAGHSRIHLYEQVRFFDLFRDGDPIDDFVLETLSLLFDYDRARHAHLTETLATYLEVGLHRKSAAQRLHIHPNTLDYRLDQVDRLLGYAVAEPSHIFRLQLALKLISLSRYGKREPTLDRSS